MAERIRTETIYNGPPIIKVTVYDPDTGEELASETITNDYVIVCAGTAHVAHTQAYATTGTHVLTVKGIKP